MIFHPVKGFHPSLIFEGESWKTTHAARHYKVSSFLYAKIGLEIKVKKTNFDFGILR
jgi:hypothetical protein